MGVLGERRAWCESLCCESAEEVGVISNLVDDADLWAEALWLGLKGGLFLSDF